MSIRQKHVVRAGRIIGAGALFFSIAGCSRSAIDPVRKIEPTYNAQTGRLELLKYDSDGDGTFDTFSYMDGSRIVRIEIDSNHDGRIDRWEYYTPDQTLEKVGVSRKFDGREDRIEHFENGIRRSAEEDSDGDGRMDKWETYAGDRIASVSFDLTRRGTPDRRIVYGADGSARVEAISIVTR